VTEFHELADVAPWRHPYLILFFVFSVSANPSPRGGCDDRHEVLAGSLKRSTALSGYASDAEPSVCRCGSNMRSNRVNSDKLTDPDLLLERKRNAWSRLRPDS
jgi:hypothetical protein